MWRSIKLVHSLAHTCSHLIGSLIVECQRMCIQFNVFTFAWHEWVALSLKKSTTSALSYFISIFEKTIQIFSEPKEKNVYFSNEDIYFFLSKTKVSFNDL